MWPLRSQATTARPSSSKPYHGRPLRRQVCVPRRSSPVRPRGSCRRCVAALDVEDGPRRAIAEAVGPRADGAPPARASQVRILDPPCPRGRLRGARRAGGESKPPARGSEAPRRSPAARARRLPLPPRPPRRPPLRAGRRMCARDGLAARLAAIDSRRRGAPARRALTAASAACCSRRSACNRGDAATRRSSAPAGRPEASRPRARRSRRPLGPVSSSRSAGIAELSGKQVHSIRRSTSFAEDREPASGLRPWPPPAPAPPLGPLLVVHSAALGADARGPAAMASDGQPASLLPPRPSPLWRAS